MQLTKIAGVLLVGVLSSGPPALGAQPQSNQARVQSSEGASIAMERDAAIDSSSDSGGEVILVETGGHTAVVVRYREGDAQNRPSSCSVSIVEELQGGGEVVVANDSILGCSLATSAKQVKASTKVKVDRKTISIFAEADKGSSEFDLSRESDGLWYVAKASFTYPEEDPVSGEIIVINESAAFQPGARAVRFSDYSYDSIKDELSRNPVE